MSGENSTAMIIRGADGKLYYVNQEALAPYELSEEQAKQINDSVNLDNSLVHVVDNTLLDKLGLSYSANPVIMVVSVSTLRNWRDTNK